jgi:hypothetical protein
MLRPPLFGTKTVTTAGTAVALVPNTPVPTLYATRIIFQADPGNTGTVTIGDSKGQTFALSTTTPPVTIDAVDNDYFDLCAFMVNASANGNKVNYIAFTSGR